MFSLGNQKISEMFVGENKISEAYLGNELVYSAPKPLKKVGDIVDWAGYTWIVVNDNGDGTIVLAMQDIYELTTFGNTTYAGSTIASKALAFENSLHADALAQSVNTTVNGVTAKVFVASEQQLYTTLGGFSYFKTNDFRKAKYNGTFTTYWTSSVNGSKVVAIADIGGTLSLPYNLANMGFRPFVTVNQF